MLKFAAFATDKKLKACCQPLFVYIRTYTEACNIIQFLVEGNAY